MTPGARLKKIREIYLSLPDTAETITWGSPHFRVLKKIIGGFHQQDGVTRISFKLEMEHAAALVASDPRFERAAYVGHKGWVSMDVSAVEDWEEVRVLVRECYRLIAPKRSLAKLEGAKTPVPAKRSAPKKAPAKKAPAKKAPARRKKAPRRSA